MTSSTPTPASRISIHPESRNSLASEHLIYFITGNPGLVAYYNTFLTTLHCRLSESFNQSSNIFHIHGQSLAGFEDDASTNSRLSPYSLEEQIILSLSSVKSQVIPVGPRKGQPYTSIILTGHSVGSYILLEILQRLRKSLTSVHIKAGILLFPTVTHIAKSPSGVKISTLFQIPDFARRASFLAKCLVTFTPTAVLQWLVRLVARMPSDAAEVTTRFLKSRMGVWQALHMAQDEMETITEDRWDEDIWGIEHEDAEHKYQIPKLIFYFGENDHWVADHTRDALMAARGRCVEEKNSSRPMMMIDDNGVDHGFCIRHSDSIAEKVKIWIVDIINES